jgi:hypothetical protein
MINYELAKKLKLVYYSGRIPNEEFVSYPTLSELIEACGKERGVDSSFKLYYHGGIIEWQAGYWKLDLEDHWEIVQEGSTPEEAVSLLWLKIKQKII